MQRTSAPFGRISDRQRRRSGWFDSAGRARQGLSSHVRTRGGRERPIPTKSLRVTAALYQRVRGLRQVLRTRQLLVNAYPFWQVAGERAANAREATGGRSMPLGAGPTWYV